MWEVYAFPAAASRFASFAGSTMVTSIVSLPQGTDALTLWA
jgi:hypothetical protein